MSNSKQFKRKLAAVPDSRDSLEKKLLKEKEVERQACGSEIDALLAKYKCGITVLVQVGDKAVGLEQVLGPALPFQVMVVSR